MFDLEKEEALDKKLQEEVNEDPIILQLQKEYDIYSMLCFNEFSVKDRIQQNPYRTMEVRNKVLQEKMKLQRIKDTLDEKTGELYDELRFNDGRNLTKTEIEKYYLPKDENLKTIREEMRKQETIVEFWEAVLDSLKSQHWALKNFIEEGKGGW